MNSLKLKLDKGTFQYLKTKFNGDIKAMEDFRERHGRDKNLGSLEDLMELNVIASAWHKLSR